MRRSGALLVLFALAVASGCGDGLRVGGSVTFDGKPIEEGEIRFVSPAVSAAAPIKGGKYESVGKLKPGKYTVNISGQLKASTPTDGPLKSGDAMKPDESMIPDNAVGNGQTVEITGAKPDLNFELKKPAK